MATIAYIALGSNLGDRPGRLAEAVAAMTRLPGVQSVEASPTYETEPVGGPAGQGPFLNGVAEVQTTLDADALLTQLHAIEADAGRDRTAEPGKNQPRCLDLDIILFGDAVIASPGLTVPHPRMHERWFVLKPLCDLNPEAMHPVLQRTAAEMLAALEAPAA
jgi:2-amino-4-hydroxy-6-hydroxymethyldihydropteridine diphosphokinase